MNVGELIDMLERSGVSRTTPVKFLEVYGEPLENDAEGYDVTDIRVALGTPIMLTNE